MDMSLKVIWRQISIFPSDKPFMGFPCGSDGKASACNVGDPGLIVGSGRFPGEEMATHSSTLAWKIPWTEEPGRLWSMGSQRVEHDWATSLSLFSLHRSPFTMLWQRGYITQWSYEPCYAEPPKTDGTVGHNKLYGSQQNCSKRWEYQTSLPVSWEAFMQVKRQQSELDMERTG